VTPRPDRHRITIAIVAILAFLLLASALRSFTLADGLRIESGFADSLDRTFEAQQRDGGSAYIDSRLLEWIVSITVGLSIVLFIVGLLRWENRASTVFLVVIGAAIALLISRIPPPQATIETPFTEGDTVPGAGEGAISIEELLDEEDAVDVTVERDQNHVGLSWVLAGAAIVGLFFVVRPRLSFGRKGDGKESDVQLPESTRDALAEVAAGGDVLAAVIRYYREAMELYRETRFSGKHTTLTPREFARRLAESGAPATAADGLTELFERTRYGTIVLSPEEEAEAVGYLHAIEEALRGRDD
jgi:hypothetical protein